MTANLLRNIILFSRDVKFCLAMSVLDTCLCSFSFRMSNPKRVCVYCGASNQCAQKFLDAGKTLGSSLASIGATVVYGGSKEGVMGTLAEGVLSAGGHVVGWMPEHLLQYEILHPNLSETHIVETMHHRKHAMMMNSDGIVALPGGIGTMEELLEAITWKRHELITSPIVIVNIDGFYDSLHQIFAKMASELFISAEELQHPPWIFVNSVNEAIDFFRKEWQSKN